jgi:flagellin
MMGLRIATNIASQTVRNNLKEVTSQSNRELSRLSSGKRITMAGDDAAGLALAKNFEAQSRSLRQAARNANDGISMVQTAEGSLNEISNILIRLRELSIQSASDTVGESERGMLNLEYQELTKEINRIANSTEFNGVFIIGDGSQGDKSKPDSLDFQVGSRQGEHNVISFETGITDATADKMELGDGRGNDILEKGNALGAVGVVDNAINLISGYRANLGAIQNRLNSSVTTLEVQSLNQESARSVIEDVDVAKASADLAAQSVVKAAGISSLAQANTIPMSAIKLIG